ncbi:DUF4292 domain-containing protein [Flavobacterium cerinum]|uniref:DUF4292 domain-containing protein n=1 Tax=Flavobacterium cerinum TaxID=2502784 RepID=A0A3S3QZY1_9FLAO|nr:DUF4292 domain-containing protein [Flavobacterium cerinum]RWX00026.1 DUF4292 domain-containing protein [Flavobacterium cerinum]
MKKSIVILFVLFTFVSCKTKQALLGEQSAGEAKSTKEIVDGHYKNTKDFKTLHIQASASYKDRKQAQKISADIKIKKDEIILVSVRFLGITMAKAIITPTRVSYYEKINGTYFDGSYAVLSRWLGTELDYAKVQNMLTGESLYDLTKGMYQASLDKERYKLQSMDRSAITKQFFFEGSNYLLKEQIISQGGTEPRSLAIQYPAYKEYPKAVLPAAIKIEAEQKDTVTINIDYNSVTFDENLTFPYDVPEGFNQIFID